MAVIITWLDAVKTINFSLIRFDAQLKVLLLRFETLQFLDLILELRECVLSCYDVCIRVALTVVVHSDQLVFTPRVINESLSL